MFKRQSLIAMTLSAALSFAPLFSETCVCSPQQTSKAFTAVAKTAMPAVVFIKVEISAPEYEGVPPGFSIPNNPFGDDDLFNRLFRGHFGGRPLPPQPQLGRGSGSLISSDGYIITNAHVVKGADKIEVTLHDGRVLPATFIGADPQTDIAVIKIEGKGLPFLEFGDSDALDVGEWVVAIGSPFELEASLTVGVVSAKGRQGLKINDFEDFIQTDAAINPGNSGGPLLNLESKIIGINTAIFTRSGGYMGICFAIPSVMAKNVMQQLIEKGSVTRGYLGVTLQPLNPELAEGFNLDKAEGVIIAEVKKDSPAEKAGIKAGDIILEYNGKPVKNDHSFRNEVANMRPGDSISLKINRKGKILTISAVFGASPYSSAPAAINKKLGIEVEPLSPEYSQQLGIAANEEGLVITNVTPGSTAAMAGLRPGFLIVAVNHKKVSSLEEYNEALDESMKNKRVLLLIRQGKMTRFYSIRID